jgi:hypothetical protein
VVYQNRKLSPSRYSDDGPHSKDAEALDYTNPFALPPSINIQRRYGLRCWIFGIFIVVRLPNANGIVSTISRWNGPPWFNTCRAVLESLISWLVLSLTAQWTNNYPTTYMQNGAYYVGRSWPARIGPTLFWHLVFLNDLQKKFGSFIQFSNPVMHEWVMTPFSLSKAQ